jgi:hypothetical protein
MLWCLQGDARRVTDSAAHLLEQHRRDGFTFALQELWLAAEELKRETSRGRGHMRCSVQRAAQNESGRTIHLQFRGFLEI